MKNLYMYIKNENIEDILKYGIKLSEYSNKVLDYSGTKKSGIISYLAPKDSILYSDNKYSCVRINGDNVNAIIYNEICENLSNFNEFICDFNSYKLGDYEEPLALITSTILPENIYLYNKDMDVPLIIENSKNFFYENSINELLNTNKFSNYELYQILLILGEQKKMLTSNSEGNIKTYKDKINGKLYTKKSNF
ncbi:putative uncharacterized protein [Clostridium sp. CAG:921]|nr:putative uncharacterized protein [Clostridium sp. CAG:921]